MLSLILPVHNAQPYLTECLQSIADQDYADYEVLAVDDGSTDGSGEVLERWAVKDSRIRVFRQENRGVSAARNVGLDHAQGVYVCFVDADDILATDYLSALLEVMGEEVDSSMGGFATFGMKDKPGVTVVPDAKKVETLEENLLEFYNYQQPQWQHYLWNRMFRRSVIERQGLHFDESIYYKEDGLFLVQYLCRSNGRVGCTDRVVYHYRYNEQGAMASIVQGAYEPKLITDLKAHNLIIEELKNRQVTEVILDKAREQAKTIDLWILMEMWKHRHFNIAELFTTESLIIRILGWPKYLQWRIMELKKLWR